ncbi:MAG: hypothetical protein AAB410_00470, partial [Patescibacteria group bacterium]
MLLNESEKTILRLLKELDKMSVVNASAEQATALMVDKLPGEQQRALPFGFWLFLIAFLEKFNL